MRLSGHRRSDVQLEDWLVFDSNVAEILPGEGVPLLKHSSVPFSRQSFEMAPVHMPNRRIPTSETLCVNSRVSLPVGTSSKSSYLQTPVRGRFSFPILFECLRIIFTVLVMYCSQCNVIKSNRITC